MTRSRVLHQHGAENRPQLARLQSLQTARSRPSRRACSAWSPGSAARVLVHRRRDHRLDERRHDRLAPSSTSIGRLRPTMPPNAAERIGVARADVGVGGAATGRGAARIGVLDDDGRRLAELEHDARGGIEIEQVRVRQLLALEHGRRRRGRRRHPPRTRPPADAGSRRSGDRGPCADASVQRRRQSSGRRTAREAVGPSTLTVVERRTAMAVS